MRRSAIGAILTMTSILIFVIVLLVLVLPIRLASYWFESRRQGWWPSFLVVLVGGLLVDVAARFLPQPWLTPVVWRYLIVLVVFCLVSAAILEMKLWHAMLLAMFITIAYYIAPSYACSGDSLQRALCSGHVEDRFRIHA